MFVRSACSSRIDSAEETATTASSSTTRTTRSNASHGPGYDFALPARVCKSVTSFSASASCRSDSSLSDNFLVKSRRKNRRRRPRPLPPIGVFWDIENCQVPKHRSAASVVQRIRDCFFEGYREVEFLVVCDVKKENPQIIQELHDAQVNLIHVASTCKNAADEKLRQSLRRFGETYVPPATVILISGDINFASDLSDLRYRRKIHVILVHNTNASDVLRQYANEAYLFAEITDNLPAFKPKISETVDLFISNLPRTYDKNPLKTRLKFLSNNCGGRVIDVRPRSGTAILRFATAEYALRAQRRLDGEDVFGRKIVASNIEQPNSKTNDKKNTKAPNEHQRSSSWNSQGSSRGDWRSPLNRTPDPQSSSNVCDPSRSFQSNAIQQPIELIVTNLDASIRDLHATLSNLVNQCSVSYDLTINYQEAKPSAIVKVSNLQDAELVISKMHHQKLGFRRMSISYLQRQRTDIEELKQRVIYLLQEVSPKPMPLYMLVELLEQRYLMKVSLWEITKLRDVCQIVEEKGGRVVSFTPEMHASPVRFQKPQLLHYCCVHYPQGMHDLAGDMQELPCVHMSLKEFGAKLHQLLESHMGMLPLLSFSFCYQAQFDMPLPTDGVAGVLLEHLITCVSNVRLKCDDTKSKVKYIVWEMNKADEAATVVSLKNSSPLATSILLLRREFIDLLKHSPKCQMPLTKFVPAYHHHFGRQLRVADYGYTKLDDLLYSSHLANVVQIIGEGLNRIVTLTHATQMRRFTSDLLRLLRNQPNKQITLTEFPEVYERVFHRPFNVVEYGVCMVQDLLDEVPENSILTTKTDSEWTISIPQRARTSVEIMRTKQFANEVVQLLSHSPNYSMLFDKFVPHYHHNYGYQCKVSNYGFTKLIELFEAIPETVKVEELPNNQRTITLTTSRIFSLLGTRILELISKSQTTALPLDDLMPAYLREYKARLNPQSCGCADVNELIKKLSDYITLTHNNDGLVLVPAQKDLYSMLSLRVWSLLVQPPHYCEANKLIFSYFLRFQSSITIAQLEELNNIMLSRTSNSEYTIFLIPEFVKAARVYNMLYEKGGPIPLATLETLYKDTYGEQLSVAEYSFFVILSRSRKRTTVSLNPKLTELGLSVNPIQEEVDANFATASSWPPPPSLTGDVSTYLTAIADNKKSPPKPDTPPMLNLSFMNWPKTPEMDFSIPFPKPETPMCASNPFTLISPAKFLTPALPWSSMFAFAAPEPNELPVPDKLLKNGVFSDDSADSGVNNSHYVSENEMDISQEQNLGANYPAIQGDANADAYPHTQD